MYLILSTFKFYLYFVMSDYIEIFNLLHLSLFSRTKRFTCLIIRILRGVKKLMSVVIFLRTYN